MKIDNCLVCGKNLIPYDRNKGMCLKCYSKNWHKENPEYWKKKRKQLKENPNKYFLVLKHEREYGRKRRKDPDIYKKLLEYGKRYRQENAEKLNQESKKYYHKHKKKNKECRQERKKRVFAHYGNCAFCGESKLELLEIDHKNNDGAYFRKQMKINSGDRTYKWIIKNNFPNTFQTLCSFCNWGKYVYGENYEPEMRKWATRVLNKDKLGGSEKVERGASAQG